VAKWRTRFFVSVSIYIISTYIEERDCHLAKSAWQSRAVSVAIVLRHYENWSLEAISQHLGRTPAAVAGLLHRGLKALRLRLQDPSDSGT
jgi:hypothetical protein